MLRRESLPALRLALRTKLISKNIIRPRQEREEPHRVGRPQPRFPLSEIRPKVRQPDARAPILHFARIVQPPPQPGSRAVQLRVQVVQA